MHSIKCVVLGDVLVGKTALLDRYVNDKYSTESIPTVFDYYTVSKIPIRGDIYDLHLHDTSGYEDYDRLRRLELPNTNILLLCFSVDSWLSFGNIRAKWVPELREHWVGVPYILVGTKVDLRTDEKTIENLALKGKCPITKRQGKELAKEIFAVKYVECSALTKENVNDVFEEAMNVALTYSEKSKKCTIS